MVAVTITVIITAVTGLIIMLTAATGAEIPGLTMATALIIQIITVATAAAIITGLIIATAIVPVTTGLAITTHNSSKTAPVVTITADLPSLQDNITPREAAITTEALAGHSNNKVHRSAAHPLRVLTVAAAVEIVVVVAAEAVAAVMVAGAEAVAAAADTDVKE